jgi:PhnB protein
MQPITPYLNFNGNASEALEFYSNAFGGQVVQKQTFGDAPEQFADLDEANKAKVLHAIFNSGDLVFMVSDCPPGVSVNIGTNVSLALDFSDEQSITQTFEAMQEGGEIIMPLQNTFWGAKFGMVTDKFGISWMFNYDQEKK